MTYIYYYKMRNKGEKKEGGEQKRAFHVNALGMFFYFFFTFFSTHTPRNNILMMRPLEKN